MDQSELFSSLAAGGDGPAYRRLARAIAEAIRQGEINEGASLPTERALAGSTGLSRVTVRAAYRALAEDGLVETRAGSGNYVRGGLQALEQPLWLLSSFSEDMAQHGRDATNRVLDLTRGAASERERKALALALDEADQVVRLTRLRLGNGRPLAIEAACLPERLVGEAQLGDGSLYAELARLGLSPSRGMQRMRAVSLDRHQAELLATSEGTAGMLIERVALLPDGQPIEYTTSHYRGDAYDFVARLNAGDLK